MNFFSDLIDRYVFREPSQRSDDVFYPSELGKCLRESFFSRRYPVTYDRATLRRFASAVYAHRFIRDVLMGSFPEVELVDVEKPFTILVDDFEISGRLDDLILVRLPGPKAQELFSLPPQQEKVLVVVEVKSVGGKALWRIQGPSRPHLAQIHPYLKATKAPVGVIWYLARDSFQDRWFTVFYDHRFWLELVERARTLRHCLKEGTLPPAEGKEDGSCWCCPFWRQCLQEG
ncbi:MAG: hypothetical protein QXR87_04210 [Candidatus Hadarchaeales archaeon]